MMSRSRRCALLAAVLLGLVGLAGCAQAPEDITTAAAEQLQAAVDSVVEATAQGRYDDAAAELARTRALLDQAADAEQLSVARYRAIDDALRRTEAELVTVIAALAEPADEPVAEAGDGDSGSGSSSGSNSGSEEKGPPPHSNAGGNK